MTSYIELTIAGELTVYPLVWSLALYVVYIFREDFLFYKSEQFPNKRREKTIFCSDVNLAVLMHLIGKQTTKKLHSNINLIAPFFYSHLNKIFLFFEFFFFSVIIFVARSLLSQYLVNTNIK